MMLLVITIMAVVALASGRVSAAGELRDLDALLQWSADLPARRNRHAAEGTAALHDRVVIVAFVSVDCTIACIARTRALDTVARALPNALRERVAFLCISTDPARDDAGRLGAFADSLVGEGSPLRFRTSDEVGTTELAVKLRYPVTALPEPPPTILVFDRRGQIAMTYAGDRLDGERILRDVASLDTFEQGIGRPPRARIDAPSSPF